MSRRFLAILSLLASLFVGVAHAADAVATFGGVKPTEAQLQSLRALGLQVQGFQHLPLALLRGPDAALANAVTPGLAKKLYPNERLHYFSNASNLSIRANEAHAAGVDGTGVTVAVIDSGIDATHPDLARRVAHNVKVVESGTAAGNVLVDMQELPFNNTDSTSGHGTHVAGIVAADNTDGLVKGVAPGASLVGYGAGEALFIFGALASFDHMLAKRVEWNIRIVNNSWGSSFRLFDPDEPINQATRAAADQGIVVVFAAGNSSTEMSLNPYSAAPWVISTGNGTLNHQRAASSSGGLEFDNSVVGPLPPGAEKHVTFSGDRIGLYHPSLSAPGTNILSTAALTGVAITTSPDRTAEASGTSMAAPHIAGIAALLLQKNPALTPTQVKSALQVTATLMPSTADATQAEDFWKVGYGFADAKAAVDLVGRKRFSGKALAKMQAATDLRVLNDRDERVLSTDYWTFNAAPASVDGTPDTRTYPLAVSAGTQAIKALVSYPSLGYVGQNPFNYELTLHDAAGNLVATSTPARNAGMSTLFVDLTQAPPAFGAWTVKVRGVQGAQDQDVLMGIQVSVAVHQLENQVRIAPAMPVFTPTGSIGFRLAPGAAGLATSPEGCNLQAGAPDADLAMAAPNGACQSASMGYAINYGAGVPASFTSAPLAAPLTIGGPATLRYYLVDPAQPAWTVAQNPRLSIEVDAVDENGELLVAAGAAEWTVCNTVNGVRTCNTGPQPVGGNYTVNLPPATLPAGSRLSILVRLSGVVTSASRTVYGGAGLTANYADAGITLTTGTLQ